RRRRSRNGLLGRLHFLGGLLLRFLLLGLVLLRGRDVRIDRRSVVLHVAGNAGEPGRRAGLVVLLLLLGFRERRLVDLQLLVGVVGYDVVPSVVAVGKLLRTKLAVFDVGVPFLPRGVGLHLLELLHVVELLLAGGLVDLFAGFGVRQLRLRRV